LFAAFLVGTAIWAVADVGLVFWPLFSRVFMFAAIGMVVALVYPQLVGRPARGAYGVAAVLAVGVAVAAGNMFVAHPSVASNGTGPGITPVAAADAQKDWAHYGNTEGGSRFAALDQINRDTVNKLKVAWTYHTGDVAISDGNGAEDQLTPLQIGNKVFICTPHNNLIALDADTGNSGAGDQWSRRQLVVAVGHVAQAGFQIHLAVGAEVFAELAGVGVDRDQAGINGVGQQTTLALRTGRHAGSNDRRAVGLGRLGNRRGGVEVSHATATLPDRRFGVDFVLPQLFAGVGVEGDQIVVGRELSSAPLIAGTTVVVGGRVADNVQTDMPGGVIRGFDVITGQMRWAFDPGNPEDKKAPAEGSTYVRSTPNSWAPMSYDPLMNTLLCWRP
jgi:quinate dehydrogenase (quinone)